MTDQTNAFELLQKLLDERYEAGREAGREAGYRQALGEISDTVKAKYERHIERTEAPLTGAGLADHPGDENNAESIDISEREHTAMSAHLKKALEYVQKNPGITSRGAYPAIRNNSALYILTRRGLLEKRGSQFFPKAAEIERLRQQLTEKP